MICESYVRPGRAGVLTTVRFDYLRVVANKDDISNSCRIKARQVMSKVLSMVRRLWRLISSMYPHPVLRIDQLEEHK